MMVQLEELEPRFPPPDLSPDRDREQGRAMDRVVMVVMEVMDEAALDLDTAAELRARR